MKKILFCIFIFVNANAFAKSSNNYVSVNLNYSKIGTRLSQNGIITQNPDYSSQEFKGEQNSFGVAVGKIFNYKKDYFLLTEIFYDDINNQISDDFGRSAGADVSINYRYGGKIGFGYNISKKNKIYISYLLTMVDSKVLWSENRLVNERQFQDGFGAGFIYSLNEKISFDLQYDKQKYEVATPSSAVFDHIRIRSHIIKLGVSYNF